MAPPKEPSNKLGEDDAAHADPEEIEGDGEYIEPGDVVEQTDPNIDEKGKEPEVEVISDEDEDAEAEIEAADDIDAKNEGNEVVEIEEIEDDDDELDEGVSEDKLAEVEEVTEEPEDKNEIEENKAEPPSAKRSQPTTSQSGTNKKQKYEDGTSKPNTAVASGKTGPKKDDSKDKVQWKSPQGYVDGEVVGILREAKEVDRKTIEASENEPRIVLKSSTSEKICVHKPDALYFD
ncbi:hypothetical protein F5Y19DRAFT_476040 [Xylariaceae sp. FL1651]|nr:hypothetical protein F5Y19DRAFT_476040 [Xylariaceae sp. FL1651]